MNSGVQHSPTMKKLFEHYGLYAFLVYFGVPWLQLPIQAVSSAAMAAVACLQPRNEARALALGGIAYTIFMMFTSISPPYVFMEPLMLVYFLICARGTLNGGWEREAATSPAQSGALVPASL
jgi:hypothetical protein